MIQQRTANDPGPILTVDEIRLRVRQLEPWFHNMNLQGVMTAPQHILGDYPAVKWNRFAHALPEDLTGKSVLDIGCNAGFHSIAMKRRGASRVLGIDCDPLYLEQARFACQVLGVPIEFRMMSVYEVAALQERFDVVLFMGVLYHLRHPLLALDLIHEHVTRDVLVFQSMQRGSNQAKELAPDYDFWNTRVFDDPAYPKMHFVEKRYAWRRITPVRRASRSNTPTSVPPWCADMRLPAAPHRRQQRRDRSRLHGHRADSNLQRQGESMPSGGNDMPIKDSRDIVPAMMNRQQAAMRVKAFLERMQTTDGALREEVVAIITAHPDDETIGIGAHLPRLPAARFIHITDGASLDGNDARHLGLPDRQSFANLRRQELERVLSLVGIPVNRAWSMNCMDQQVTIHIGTLTLDLQQWLEHTQPPIIFTHPFEGGHPDHDATALIVHVAVRRMVSHGLAEPLIVEMACYHDSKGEICTGKFLERETDEFSRATHRKIVLSDGQRELKQKLMACYQSQRDTLKDFQIEHESFRLAPRYDFTQPPHEGTLFYERRNWGMSRQRFCTLAAEAMDALRVQGAI